MLQETEHAGPLTRARASVAAVETLDRIRREARTVATDAERVALSGFTGWGPLAPVFAPKDDSWADLYERLKGSLSDGDLRTGMQGTYNAFYTPSNIAKAMWQMLREFGYTGGAVAEFGCGAGMFFSTAPAGTPLVGVERDPTAAAVCQLLHPHARVINDELQNVQVGSGFAAVIGNVPYGKVSVFDPTAPDNVTGNLHNYFIWRAVQALAPGGIAVLLTSRFTMDAVGDMSRSTIGKDADLVGALRLPNGALGGGTDVAADIVILRRRARKGPKTYSHDWKDVEQSTLGHGLYVNRYWQNEPGAVLGRMVRGKTTQYGLSVAVEDTGGDVVAKAMAYVRGDLVPQAKSRNLMWVAPPDPTELDATSVISREGWPEGTMRLDDKGGVLVVKEGRALPLPAPKTPGESASWQELLALLRLRDLAVALVGAEADHDRPDRLIDPVRADTRAAYEAYVKRFGALNRYTMRRGADDPETGLPTYTRKFPTMKGFRHDPDAPLVFALEMYEDDDEDTDEQEGDTCAAKAKPAPILFERQNRPVVRPDRTDDPAQALLWCLDAKGGRVDLDYIGDLLGRSMPGSTDDVVHGVRAGTVALLGDLIYLEPQTRQWQCAEEYLSDDVRAKLLHAKQAASEDPAFERNVEALTKVQPKWLGPAEITANLGTPWIKPGYIEQFIAETLGHEVQITRVAAGNHWEVETTRILKSSVAATARWGTQRVNAYDLMEMALNNVVPTVYDEIEVPGGDKKRVKNAEASLLAVTKQQELRAEFSDWVWRDPDRADVLVHLYNTQFNNLVSRKFDGSHLTIDGMAPWFKPYGHQLDFGARAIATGAALCGHPVGAGKTYTMAMVVMKLRQLGLVRKPMIVVPNHLIEQVDREIRQLFPAARILTGASKTVSRNRLAFTARCATQEWDVVLVTHSAFNAMGVDPETQVAYIEDVQEELYSGVVEGAGGELAGRMVKQLAKKLDEMKAKVLKLRDGERVGKDAGVRFEQLGVDYLAVDEFHYYKNLAVPVRTDGFSVRPSKRATDLDMKLRYLSGRGSGRYASLFSGTPMSNTMLELYVCMHYTMRPYLQKIGIGSPDAWAAAFVQFVTGVEVTVDGGDFRMHTRPSLFVNARQLYMILSRVADTRTAKQLGLKVPESEVIVEAIEPTEQTAAYSMNLVDRAEKARKAGGRPAKGADNMLKICGDGRRVATDPKLVGIDDDGRHKLHVVAERIIQVWKANPGKLQIAFCDIGTPFDPKAREAAKRRAAAKAMEWETGGPVRNNDWGGLDALLGGDWGSEAPKAKRKAEPVVLDYQTYGRLRRILVDHGMDVRRIRFIHDAKDDASKAQLFRDCRRGKVDVIVGSTDKLGVGTNIQRLVVAMHHIDAPFRPADVRQRDGRGVRPGNINKMIYIYRYVTKRTFDAYMWQMLHRKLTFIEQMLCGDVPQVIEDISGSDVLSFAEIKAAATDQPLLMEKTQVESEVKRLRNLFRNHRATIDRAHRDVPRMRTSAEAAGIDAKVWETIAAAAPHVDLSDEAVEVLHEAMGDARKYNPPKLPLADGLTLEWRERRMDHLGEVERHPDLTLVTADGFVVEEGYRFWKPGQVKRRIQKLLDGAAKAAAKVREAQERFLREADALEQEIDRPFTQAEALTAALARLDQIEAELRDAAVKAEAGSEKGAVVAKAEPAEAAPVTPEPTPVKAEPDPVASVHVAIDLDALAAALGEEDEPAQPARDGFSDEVDADLAADLMAIFG